MGRSVDWLDIYRDHGPESVSNALRAALDKARNAPPAPASHAPPAPHTPHQQNNAADGADPDRPGFVPDPRLVLPSQAGPRARIVLERQFGAGGDGAGDGEGGGGGGCWQLRRFGGEWYVYRHAGLGLSRWTKVDEELLRSAVRGKLEEFWTRRQVEKGGVEDENGRRW